MSPKDCIHIDFTIEKCMLCYKVMPFGLKITGAKYQRLMNKMFTKQLGRIIEFYIDDMVVKSKEADQYLSDIDECFQVLRHTKCALTL